jgi:bacterioferritin
MKGDAKVIEYLNKALRHELTAVNQYWLAAASELDPMGRG